MSYGRLVEVGTPRDLYMKPQTEFVASFLGTANILLGQTEGEQVQIGPHVFGLTKEATRFSADGRVQVVFRPEDIALASSKEDLDCPALGEGTLPRWDLMALQSASGSNSQPSLVYGQLPPLWHLAVRALRSMPAVRQNKPPHFRFR